MTSALLINEPPLQVLPALAKVIGLNEAIILQQVHYWISLKSNNNIVEGRKWVYNTYEQWREQFPFWSKSTIERTISNLEDSGVLLSREGQKRLKHYSINYDVLSQLPITSNCGDEVSRQNDAIITSNCGDHHVKMTRSYIDTENTQRIHRERDARARATHTLSEEKIPKEEESLAPLDENWALSPEWREHALELGLFNEEINLAEKRFRNHYLCATTLTRKFTPRGWKEKWDIWCSGDLQRKGRPVVSNPKNSLDSTIQQSSKKSSDPRIQKWYDLQPKLRERIGIDNHKAWIEKHLELIRADGKAIFKATSTFTRDWIYRTFRDDLALILAEIDPKLSKEWNMEFVVENDRK